MPTLVAESKTIQRDLLTAEDFLDWHEPGGLPPVSVCLAEMS